MNPIADCLPANRRELRSQSVDRADMPMLPTDAIDTLWISMADVYGHRWTSGYGADPATGAGRTWAIGLTGLSQEQVAQGVRACIASGERWPPTLPEFRSMCLGIPSLAAVRSELRLDVTPGSAFTRAVWSELDAFRYRHASTDQSERMLQDAYGLVRERTMRGLPLPEEPIASIKHERPEFKAAKPEQVHTHHLAIKELLHDVD